MDGIDTSVLQVFVMLLTSFILFLSMMVNRNNAERQLRLEVLKTTSSYMRKFDRLKEKVKASKSNEKEIENIYYKFWAFQREQFYVFKNGLIDKTDYSFWLYHRVKEYHGMDGISPLYFNDCKCKYVAGYKNAMNYFDDKEFNDFMVKLFALGKKYSGNKLRAEVATLVLKEAKTNKSISDVKLFGVNLFGKK